ncbi:FtsX-like permease family protein [Kitasatospora sp. NE20-6]|uniref:FtsX-like permease family protein n=1 Tax=Kitasatospora sp. NE20-6 TaxID=2859066 RepID=UPI0038B36438
MVLATAGTVTALLLAGALLDSAAGSWHQRFTRAHGAHLSIEITGEAVGGDLSGLDGVVEVGRPLHTASATLVGHNDIDIGGGADQIPLTLRGAEPEPPTVSKPLLVAGTWLAGPDRDSIVVERSLALAAWIQVGDHLTVRGSGRTPEILHVVGIAESPDRTPFPDVGAGLVWVPPVALDLIEPDPGRQGLAIELRLKDPGRARAVAQAAVTTIGPSRIGRVSTWIEARDAWQRDDQLAGLLLGLCGLTSLTTAAIAVAGASAGRLRGRLGDIAVLKALGFTPAQVVKLFVFEHALLAGSGFLAGSFAAAILLPKLSPDGNFGFSAAPGGTAAAAIATALGMIAAAGAIPALRASRAAPVPPPDGALPLANRPGAARLAMLWHLPPAISLGTRAALDRRFRSAVAVFRLAVPVAVCCLALTTWSTLEAFEDRPESMGLGAALTVRGVNSTNQTEVARILARRPEVVDTFPGTELEALAVGRSATLTLRALGSPPAPYPFSVVEGRQIEAADEAVAGQGALDLLDAKVGQRVLVSTDGTIRNLHIVGRTLEPARGGRVLSVGLDTLDRPPKPGQPEFLAVILKNHADAEPVRRSLAAAGGGHLDVRPIPNPFGQLPALRGAVVGLVLLTALVALAELLTAASVGLREHRHDVALLRAIGLAPRQVVALLATRGAVLASAGVATGMAAGVPLTLWLIDFQGAVSGVGAGIARSPSASVLLTLAALAVATAALTSALPAMRIASTPAGNALHRL